MTKKIDFAVIISVKNANPNGDPLGGNRPRTTSDGLGEISDVCLKRKIRNRLQNADNDIFVQSDVDNRDGKKSLSDRFDSFLKSLPKDKQNNKDIVAARACEKWVDVRSFGQVFAFKKRDNVDEVSLGIRGPVTIQSAFSIEPVIIESIQITKSVNSETTEDGKKSSDTMGLKHRVNSAVYISYGSISVQLAEKTGFTDEDASRIKEALITLFEGDESSARPSGSMEVLNVFWWTHTDKTLSSAKIHRSLNVNPDGTYTLERIDGIKTEVFEGQ